MNRNVWDLGEDRIQAEDLGVESRSSSRTIHARQVAWGIIRIGFPPDSPTSSALTAG